MFVALPFTDGASGTGEPRFQRHTATALSAHLDWVKEMIATLADFMPAVADVFGCVVV